MGRNSTVWRSYGYFCSCFEIISKNRRTCHNILQQRKDSRSILTVLWHLSTCLRTEQACPQITSRQVVIIIIIIIIIISVLFLSGFAHKGICYTSATLCPQDNSSLAGVKLKLVQRLRLRTGLPWWILKKLDRLRLRDGLPWWIWKKWTNLDYIPDCPDGFVKMDNGNWWVVKEKGTIFRSALMSIDMTH